MVGEGEHLKCVKHVSAGWKLFLSLKQQHQSTEHELSASWHYHKHLTNGHFSQLLGQQHSLQCIMHNFGLNWSLYIRAMQENR